MARMAVGLLVVFPLLAVGDDISSAPVACRTILVSQLKQDSAETRKQCQQAAERGDAAGQTYVGMMYQYGQGVDKNSNEAMNWYKKAARQGYLPAQYCLGMIYREIAGEGSFWGIAINYKESAKWLTKAAEQGYAPAQQGLGAAYFSGYGVPQDVEKAMEWYKKAAEQGLVTAQTALGGKYYHRGNIATKKGETDKAAKCFKQAIEWYEKAEAYSSLGDVHAAMGNDAEALKWYRKAVEEDKGGRSALAHMYAAGRGVPQSDEEALKWAMGTGNDEAGAQFKLGLHFLNPKTGNDPKLAEKWLRRAAEQGHVIAQYRLARMYSEGQGIAKNAEEAEKWYRKAAEQGNRSAQDALRAMGK